MQRTVIILLAVALIGTATFLAITIMDKRELEAELASAVPPPSPVQTAPPPREPTPEPEPEPAVAEPAVVETPPERTVDPTAEPPAGNPGNSFATMMENPVMRDVIKQQMLAQSKALYAGFFEKYGVDDELAQPVYDLLLERQMAALKHAGVLFDKNATQEAKDSARESVTASMKDYTDQIRDLLGDEAFEDFDLYEKMTGERMELNSLRGAMESGGQELTVEKEAQLMEIMYEERNNFDFTNNFADQNKAFENEFSKENFQRFEEEYTDLQERISTRVADVLSPEELAIFTKNQADYRNMIKAGIEMQTSMFGGGSE